MHRSLSKRAFLGSLAATLIPLTAQSEGNSNAPAAPLALNADGFLPLDARKTDLRIAPAPADNTHCLTYNGITPGPLLRLKYGEEARVRLTNHLDQPTSLHWHGLRNDNGADGVAGLTQKALAPGATQDIRFKPDSGMILYRPAGLIATPEQVCRGLVGLMIVDEARPPEVDRDMVVLMQDWKLDLKGDLTTPYSVAEGGDGRVGPLITANARPAPLTDTLPPGARVRLRLANACAARIAIATLSGTKPFVMAIDGQPCEAFEPVRNTIPLAPGARFDIILDMPTKEGDEVKIGLWNGQDQPLRDFLTLTARGVRAKERGPVESLAPNPALPPEIRLGEAKKSELVLEPPKAPGKVWTFNGEARGYAGKPLFSVKRGAPVSFGFANKSGSALAMHVHGVSMRLLHDKDDGWEPYWRNAVIVPKGATKHVALLAETPGKWAVRCDIADHEAAGLATWFEVT